MIQHDYLVKVLGSEITLHKQVGNDKAVLAVVKDGKGITVDLDRTAVLELIAELADLAKQF
jgi:hypothetical protein